MRRLLYFLIILLTPGVSAIIDINSTDMGCDYIRWNWTDGLDVSDIYIDGVATCGYETTLNTTLVTGLSPGEIHRIDVFTATDTGYNITSTSPILSCLIPSGGGGGSNDNSSYLIVGLAIGLLLTILYLRRQT